VKVRDFLEFAPISPGWRRAAKAQFEARVGIEPAYTALQAAA
jgi:hypothetical protein